MTIDANHCSVFKHPRCLVYGKCLTAILVALCFQASVAHGQSSKIHIASVPDIAIKGSDLIIQLNARNQRISWPQTIRCTVGNRRVNGTVAWLAPRWSAQTRWTDPSEPVSVLTKDVTASEGLLGRPILLVPIPWDATGTIRLLGEEWEPEWMQAPKKLTGMPLPPVAQDASPSRTDPFEYFRWVLMAESAGCEAPPFDGNMITRRLASAIAGEWRVALDRISRSSKGIASEIRERLLATATDESRPEGDRDVAVWLTGAKELAILRGIMLNSARSEIDRARSALAWIEARSPFLAWFEMIAGDRVRIVLANPTPAELLVEVQWQGSDGPVGLLCPPGSISRHALERPSALLPENSLASEILILSMQGSPSLRLDAGSGAIPVRPPGAIIGPMLLPLTLAGASEGFRDSAPVSDSTTAILRRRFNQWEVFIDCRRNSTEESDRILLQIGNMQDPIALLEVTGKGVWRVRRGTDDSELDVQVEEYPDRWRCRISLPESWLVEAIGPDSGGSVLLGLRRDGPGAMRQFAGLAPPAWRSDIAEIAFDLGVWGDASTDGDR